LAQASFVESRLVFWRGGPYNIAHEEDAAAGVEPQTKPRARVSQTHAHAGGPTDASSSSTEGTLAAHPRLSPRPLKRTEAFREVSRRGRWAKGSALSVGATRTALPYPRLGLRTRRGLKGAVKRNRLKRQVRAIVSAQAMSFRPGADVVVVIHPPAYPIATNRLAEELRVLCQKLRVLS
jgi:ribonuclease P protein component